MNRFAVLAAVSALGLGASAMAEGVGVIVVDVSGWVDGSSALIPLPAGHTVNGIGWSIELTPVGGGAWYSDGVFSFGDPVQIFLTPGAGFNSGGPPQRFESPGILKLGDLGLPDITPDDNGNLLVAYSDGGWGVNVKEQSYIYLQIIPAPGAIALLGVAGLMGRRRRA